MLYWWTLCWKDNRPILSAERAKQAWIQSFHSARSRDTTFLGYGIARWINFLPKSQIPHSAYSNLDWLRRHFSRARPGWGASLRDLVWQRSHGRPSPYQVTQGLASSPWWNWLESYQIKRQSIRGSNPSGHCCGWSWVILLSWRDPSLLISPQEHLRSNWHGQKTRWCLGRASSLLYYWQQRKKLLK